MTDDTMPVVLTGVAHPWQCDVLGHLTTRHYTALFDDASYHLLHRVFGWQGATDDDSKLGFVDVKHVVEFKEEVRAGDLIEIRAMVTNVGNKSLRAKFEMVALKSLQIAATLESVMVLFDLEKRAAVEFSNELRELAKKHV